VDFRGAIDKLTTHNIHSRNNPGNTTIQRRSFLRAADDELAHVRDLRATFASFGLTPPALPTIDLVNSFQLLTTEAGLNRDFDPLGSETYFLLASFFFEENCSSLFVATSRTAKALSHCINRARPAS
jgi:hypothetical protein